MNSKSGGEFEFSGNIPTSASFNPDHHIASRQPTCIKRKAFDHSTSADARSLRPRVSGIRSERRQDAVPHQNQMFADIGTTNKQHKGKGQADFLYIPPSTRSCRVRCDAGAHHIMDKCAQADVPVSTSSGVRHRSTRFAHAPSTMLDAPAPSDLQDEDDDDFDCSSDVADNTPTLRPRSGSRSAKPPLVAPRRATIRPRVATLLPAAEVPQTAAAAPETFECPCCFSQLPIRNRVTPADCACAADAGRFCAGCVRGWVNSHLDAKVSPPHAPCILTASS